jgi:hypothetical protein
LGETGRRARDGGYAVAAFFGLLLAFAGAARTGPAHALDVPPDPRLPRPVDPRLQMSVVTTVRGHGQQLARTGDTLDVRFAGKPPSEAAPDGGPFSFVLGAGEVIEGWDQALVGMRVGEKRRLVIPPALAYGSAGQGGVHPGETLVYEIELVSLHAKEHAEDHGE